MEPTVTAMTLTLTPLQTRPRAVTDGKGWFCDDDDDDEAAEDK